MVIVLVCGLKLQIKLSQFSSNTWRMEIKINDESQGVKNAYELENYGG